MTLACLASQSCTELGPTQPQLVILFTYSFFFGEEIIGIQPHWKLRSQKDDLTKGQEESLWKMTLACLASQSCTELDPDQPQLVYILIRLCYKRISTLITDVDGGC